VKIILDLPEPESEDEIKDAVEYVRAPKARVEQRIYNNFPGAMLEYGDGSIWVRDVKLELS
jgi:hypothetical protein